MALYVGPHGGPSGPAYDVMQVCKNGHVIIDSAQRHPEHRKAFCPSCGAATIMECPECCKPIQGALARIPIPIQKPPNNCHECGSAFPWHADAMTAAAELLRLELEAEDAAQAEAVLADVVTETPRTQLATAKLRRILEKVKGPAYDVTVKVISDVAAESVRKTLGIP